MSSNQTQGASIEAELLPCPFCGGNAVLTPESWPDGMFHRLRCEGCGFSQMFRIREHAVNAWNRRTPAAAAEAVELLTDDQINAMWSDAAVEAIKQAGTGIGNGDVAYMLRPEIFVRKIERAAIAADRAQRKRAALQEISDIGQEIEAGPKVKTWQDRAYEDPEFREPMMSVDKVKFMAAEIAALRAQLVATTENLQIAVRQAWKANAELSKFHTASAISQPAELDRLREIARLIGSIFVHGDFKAETYSERELEKLLRAQGTFYESLADYDAGIGAQPDQRESAAEAQSEKGDNV